MREREREVMSEYYYMIYNPLGMDKVLGIESDEETGKTALVEIKRREEMRIIGCGQFIVLLRLPFGRLFLSLANYREYVVF